MKSILKTRGTYNDPNRTTKKSVRFAAGTKERDAEGPNKYHIIDAKYRMFINETMTMARDQLDAIDALQSRLEIEQDAPSAVFELYDPSRPNDYDDYVREKQERVQRMRVKSAVDTLTEKKKKAEKKSSFAEKMLKKMGWEEGKGLGKSQQGISSCLIPTGNFNQLSEADKRLSKCMCILNMVGRTELDSMLREETIAECSKYGRVLECVVYVNPLLACEPEEEVTIFVQFEFEVDCQKAIVATDGRYFGGRKVKCYFFDEERFLKGKFLD